MRLTIEKLVYGGDGLSRTEHGVVFVPGTAAGDVVEAEIVERKKDYASAKVINILEPSPDRQQPFCPNHETEGCCHWQHIRYPKQVDYKEKIVRESLRRLARLEWNNDIGRITGPDRNYRLRATFHVFAGKLGFVNGPIRQCASLVPELNQFMPTVDATGAREVHALSAPEVVTTLVLNDGSRKRRGRAMIDVNGLHYQVTADTFFQPNRFLLAPFINEVIEQTGPSPRHVLELYAGSGFFSIPLARGAQEVIAVESSGSAVRQALKNAGLNKTPHLRVIQGEAPACLGGSTLKPDVVVLDPPRAGCGIAATNRIAEMKPSRIVYISCNPSTFAREAAILSNHAFELRKLTLVDQFPNTYHIETVALFELR